MHFTNDNQGADDYMEFLSEFHTGFMRRFAKGRYIAEDKFHPMHGSIDFRFAVEEEYFRLNVYVGDAEGDDFIGIDAIRFALTSSPNNISSSGKSWIESHVYDFPVEEFYRTQNTEQAVELLMQKYNECVEEFYQLEMTKLKNYFAKAQAERKIYNDPGLDDIDKSLRYFRSMTVKLKSIRKFKV